MQSETKICKNCDVRFVIEPDDYSFYETIGVPAPIFCFDCRLQRKLAYRNERRLYKRICDLCKKSVIALFPQEASFPVYCTECWWSDNWDPMRYGQDYDLSRGFFEQYEEFSNKVPHLGMPSPSNNHQSEYTSWVNGCKNCYLVFGSPNCEEVFYGELLNYCRNSADCTNCNSLELSYECLSSNNCYHSIWCVSCVNCTDCYFCFDCRGSNNCFLSFNQRNKSYLILNKQYSKEEWENKMKNILGSYSKFEESLNKFRSLFHKRALHKFANLVKVVNSTGNDLAETKNAYHCFDSSKTENCRYVSYGEDIKDCVDSYAIVEKSELCYECFSTRLTSRSRFMIGSWDSNLDMQYSQFVIGGSNLFGCMGMRKKSYCILNKQYTKEGYGELTAKIIADMKKRGEYGEFFPIAHSPFSYNETLANDYYPLSKEQALRKGYSWRDNVGGTFGKETVDSLELADNIQDTKDDILNQIFACSKCTKNYKIISLEMNFYRAIKAPIPRKCPDCRYYERLSFKNPRKLFSRKCACDAGRRGYQNIAIHFHGNDPCPNEFETSYAPDRPEIVYCEQCYNSEVV